jgi:VIT1/CCC1 family predicted Fe2+/Mn2+ transporter
MPRHKEAHLIDRIGWLRASVLGANDGIVSTASLIVGVAAAQASPATILMTGIAGLVAGAMSMAAGEYVSVSSQSDTENADRARETEELATIPEKEREELVGIYEARGLDRALAEQVADKLTAHDALATHLRDELGMATHSAARPVQAALAWPWCPCHLPPRSAGPCRLRRFCSLPFWAVSVRKRAGLRWAKPFFG